MSEFDAFEGAEQAPVEEDPAAAFLAREKDEMAELEGDGFDATPATQEAAPAQDSGEIFEPVHGYYGDTSVSDSDAYSAIKTADKLRTEPEKIRKWREEQKTQLEEKDEESEKKKGEWREIAKKELEDWYKHSQEQLEKTKQNNRHDETETKRDAEVQFIKDRDESGPGQDWERICRMCDFNPKTARNARDVSRMRSILLQLKQTPLVR